MKHSNLARRLEEFEADIAPLRLTTDATARLVATREDPGMPASPSRPARRAFRAGAIRTRDQGLRSFRVC